MADDVITTIDEATLTIWQKLQEVVSAATEKLSKLKEGTREYINTSKDLNKAVDTLKKYEEKLPVVAKLFGETTDKVAGFKIQMGEAAKTASAAFSSFQGVVESFAKQADIAFVGVNDNFRNLVNPLAEAGTTVGQVPFLKGINEALKNLTQTQTVAREAFVRTGHSVEDAETTASEYPQVLRRMAAATGLSTKELNNMNRELSFLGPSVLQPIQSGIKDITGSIDKGITPTALLASVARGLGMSMQEATAMSSEAFMKFNQQPVEVARSWGQMAAAATKAGVEQRSVAIKAITEASSSLGIFGQKTDAAANVWSSFARTLKDVVPLQQVNQMVSDLTTGIASMDIQARSFISMMSGMSGGATALGGGLKMELALRTEGGLEKNLEALTSSLSRFGGGQIITLQQAADNPQFQAQFQVQRQMLGQLAGIRGQEQQNRVLEVLQKVQTGGISQVQGAKELQNAFKGGVSIQQKQLTALERIENLLRATVGGKLDRRLEAINEKLSPSMETLRDLGTTTEIGQELVSAEAKSGMRQTGFGAFQLPNIFASEKDMTRSQYRGAIDLAKELGGGIRGETRIVPQFEKAAKPTRIEDVATLKTPTTIAPTMPIMNIREQTLSATTIGNNIVRDLEAIQGTTRMARREELPAAARGIPEMRIGETSPTRAALRELGEYKMEISITAESGAMQQIRDTIKKEVKSAVEGAIRRTNGTSTTAQY